MVLHAGWCSDWLALVESAYLLTIVNHLNDNSDNGIIIISPHGRIKVVFKCNEKLYVLQSLFVLTVF